jgi:glucose/arabinose dehydrogenase
MAMNAILTVRSRRRIATVAVVLAMAMSLSACLGTPPGNRGPNPDVTISTVETGLDHPWDLAFAPAPHQSWLLTTERFGRVSARQLESGNPPVVLGQIGVAANGEGGLLGMAIDPDFASNRSIYLCYTTNSDVRLSRFTVSDPFTAGGLALSADIVTGMPVNPSGRHSGCRPRFRPTSNPPELFVGTGDSATDGTIPQNLQSLGGKVLCVHGDGSACPTNPGIGDPNVDDRIYSWGHRNVQGIAFTPGGGGWSVEHGSDRDDEVNLLLQGDFGWNPVPSGGGTAYDESQPMTRDWGIPATWTSGSPTIAPSGAAVISGAQWKDWDGALAMAVLKGKDLHLVYIDENSYGLRSLGWFFTVTNEGRIRSVVQGPDGNLYLTTDNGSGNDKIVKVAPQ